MTGRAASAGRLASQRLPAVVVAVAIIVVWELYVRVNDIPVGILPAPSMVLGSLVEDRALFASNIATTVIEIGVGFALGLALGVGLAIGIHYSTLLARTVEPLVLASQAVPIFAFAPLLIIWLGFGIEPKVVVVALGVFFPVTVNMTVGLREVDPGMIALMRTFPAGERQILRYVRLPNSVPYLVPAAQVGMTYAVIGAVISEWIGAESGIGRVMITANSVARTDQLFAAMVIVTVVALVLVGLVGMVGRRLTRWQRIGA
jgi:ABC-type nitrate/sulfonate/bicarbonate transport system permease component